MCEKAVNYLGSCLSTDTYSTTEKKKLSLQQPFANTGQGPGRHSE